MADQRAANEGSREVSYERPTCCWTHCDNPQGRESAGENAMETQETVEYSVDGLTELVIDRYLATGQTAETSGTSSAGIHRTISALLSSGFVVMPADLFRQVRGCEGLQNWDESICSRLDAEVVM